MAVIPELRLQIEKRIEEKTIKQDFREHIGASVLGDKCMRKIWLGFYWVKEREIPARLHRLFNRGHAEELVVIEDLINAGCKVEGVNIDKTIHKRFKTIFGHKLPKHKQPQKTFLYGFGGASKDGTIYNLVGAPKTPHLFECKTSNTKNFNHMKKYGVRKSNLKHFVQVQIYMKLFGLKRCLYVMVCKEDDRRYYERIKYDSKFTDEYVKKGEYIVKSEAPPPRISDDIDTYPCKFCDERLICFHKFSPCRNCRTCENVLFESDGEKAKIVCSLNDKRLKYKKQVKGCKKYKLNPVFGS